jgi:hypothetical protein
MTTAELLAKHGIAYVFTKSGKFTTTCPNCAGGYLNVEVKKDGVVWYCPVCHDGSGESFEQAATNGKGNGKRKGKLGEPTAIYDYPNESGERLFQVLRFEPKDGPKKFLQRTGPEQKKWSIKGVRRVLYRLPEVIAAIANKRAIVVTEGEKDVETLRKHGFTATTIPMGATSEDKQKKGSGWLPEYSESLRGGDVVLCGDNDDQGREHVRIIARCLAGVAGRLRILDLALHWGEIEPSDDVTAWFAAGHTKEELEALIAGAPDHLSTQGNGSAAVDDNAELERLAKMGTLDYERTRKDAGKRLGISRLSLLDGLVKAKRAELGLDGGDGLQGRPIEFPEPEPWPEPVNGAELLDSLAKAIRAHVVISDAACDACALWVVHSYLIRHFAVSPKLSIRSPVKGCGKSTLLEVLNNVVHRPFLTSSISPAALFRLVESHHPTLLIDEVDTFVGDDLDLKGMLNASHRHDGYVTRTVGESFEPRRFGVYAATALSGIGRLADTLADRSLPIELKRRLPGEEIKQLRVGRTGHLDELRRRITRWVTDHGERVAGYEPAMPESLVNRQADNWFVLLAIAEVAAGDWPQRAREAALKVTAASDEVSRLELLLSDIRDIFAAPTVEQISSALLVERLVAIEARPWAEYGKSGKPITQIKLARLLREACVAPEQIWITQWDDKAGEHLKTQTRGYLRARFDDVFARYLPPLGGSTRQAVTNPDVTGTSEIFESSQAESVVTTRKCGKSNNDGVCDDLTTRKGGNGTASETRAAEPCGERSSDSPEPCAYCGRPGGNAVAFGTDGGFIRLHRVCEDPWIENRMAEEGIWRA